MAPHNQTRLHQRLLHMSHRAASCMRSRTSPTCSTATTTCQTILPISQAPRPHSTTYPPTQRCLFTTSRAALCRHHRPIRNRRWWRAVLATRFRKHLSLGTAGHLNSDRAGPTLPSILASREATTVRTVQRRGLFQPRNQSL